MPNPLPSFRPHVDTFDDHGGQFELIDPAGLLRDASPGARQILHAGTFPYPVRGISVLLSRGVEHGAAVLLLRGRIKLVDRTRDRATAPPAAAVDGRRLTVDDLLPPLMSLVDEVARRITRQPSPARRPVPIDVDPIRPPQIEAPRPRPTRVCDPATGLTATITYGAPTRGHTSNLVQATIPADTAQPAHLRAFVRLLFDIARQQVGQPDNANFFAGRTYRVSRYAEDFTDGSSTAEVVRLDQVGGLDHVVGQLREVADSFNHPEAMARWGARRPQGLLFYGPPGTGKTMLAKALATEIGGTLREIRTPEIVSKWLGESEKNIKRIFAEARGYRTPTVLLFDEFDSIITYAGMSDGSAAATINSIAGIFKQEMNNLVGENPNIIVVATTNFPERIDRSLVRSGRFDVKISVPLPDAGARADILGKMLRNLVIHYETNGFRMFADDVDIAELVTLTAGTSGADLRELLRRVRMAKAMQEASGRGTPSPITQHDLVLCLGQLRTQPRQ